MSNSAHLEELINRQTDPIAKRLLEEFASLARNADVKVADYPIRLRQLMDKLFKEATDAAS